MKPINYDVDKLAEALQGTPAPIDNVANQIFGCEDFDVIADLSGDELGELDARVMNCTNCGWWCETSDGGEYDTDWYCNECRKMLDYNSED